MSKEAQTRGLLRGNPNWVKGVSGNPSGRGRKQLFKRLEEVLFDAGKDPVVEILKLIEDPEIPVKDKLGTWIDLLPYCHAKKRELAPEDDVRATLEAMSREQLIERLEADLAILKTA